MIISIHQPSYFPWLGLIHKIKLSDAYILMDEVQLAPRAFQHRNLFLTNNGQVKYLTIPIEKNQLFEKKIKDLKIAQSNWQKDHINFIKNNYGKHPYFEEVFTKLLWLNEKKYTFLIDILTESMIFSLEACQVRPQIIFQSNMDYEPGSKKGELIMALLSASKATTYLSGIGAKEYLDESKFNNNLKLVYQSFKHPEYKQLNSNQFVPGLSCLDLLFNIGFANLGELVKRI